MARSDAGFTLLEVIVALAIAAASVASLYQIYALGWRSVRLAGIDSSSLEVARNQLASAGVETPLEAGETSGISNDGISWTSTIERYEGDGASNSVLGDAQAKPVPYWVAVRVTWREGPARAERTYELKTIKLGRTP